jgi:hypothetical protein
MPSSGRLQARYACLQFAPRIARRPPLKASAGPRMKGIASLLASFVFAAAAQAGTWGDGSFENDDALDWVVDCTKANSIAPVRTALDAALRAKYLDASEGSAAVAAAEVVAAALGRPSPKLPSELNAWIQRQPTDQLARLAPLAQRALFRVKDPKVSELRQLWSEGKPNEWLAVIANLESRLAR